MRLAAPQVDEIDLETPAIHVLRGPRQVGKSTDLKLLVQRALRADAEPRRVVYLSLDLLEDQPPSVLLDSVNRALELAGAADGDTRLILLDEVTSPRSWQTGVKALWDEGRIDRDIVVGTGSSAARPRAEPEGRRSPGSRRQN